MATLKLELGTETLDSPVRERDLGTRERSGQELAFYEHVRELDLDVVERELEAWEVDFAAREVDLDVREREFGILARGKNPRELNGGVWELALEVVGAEVGACGVLRGVGELQVRAWITSPDFVAR